MLIEKQKIFGRLSAMRSLQLKIHLSMCKACQSYVKQSNAIDKGLEKHISDQSLKNIKLSNNVKEQIINKIKEI